MTDPLREALNEMQTKLAEGWQERRAQGGIFGTSISDIVYNFPVNIEPVDTQYIRWTTKEGYDSWTTETWTYPPEPEWRHVEDFAGHKMYRRIWEVGQEQWAALPTPEYDGHLPLGMSEAYGAASSRMQLRRTLLRNREMPVRRAADGGLVGWRYWTLRRQRTILVGGWLHREPIDAVLLSPHRLTEWGGPTLTAEVWSDESACEGAAGIHASLRPCPEIPAFTILGYGERHITGRVRGYGRYVLGTRGWRAERVVIDYLRVPSDIYDEVKGPLSERYQCEVRRQWR